MRTHIPSILLLLTLPLSSLHILLAAAQSSPNDDAIMATPALPPATPTLDIFGHTTSDPVPIGISTLPPSSSPTAAQYGPGHTSTDHTSPADDHINDPGVLNYYFLLLALLIIILGIIYLFYMKRQRQKVARTRQNGQRALARDLERWGGGGPWGPGRFRGGSMTVRGSQGRRQQQGLRSRDEGLDERGEAPPPYVPKEPEPAYDGQGIPLRNMGRGDQKPPDYDEGPSSTGGREGAGAGSTMRYQ